MAKEDWWFKFEYLKWLTDERLNRCSLATQGLWMRCICMMRKGGTAKLQGTAVELGRLLSVTPTEFKKAFTELDRTKTATVTQTAHFFTLMSRKYAKELKVREQSRLRKRRERCHVDVTTKSQRIVISKEKEVRKEEEELHCEETINLRETPQAASPPRKGTRLPEPFMLTAEMKAYANEKRPGLNVIEETEKFANYYRAKTGRDAAKLDWIATWRNWILNAIDRPGQKGGGDGGGSEKPAWVNVGKNYEPIEIKCASCADLGYIKHPDPAGEFSWSYLETPCPDCSAKIRGAA